MLNILSNRHFYSYKSVAILAILVYSILTALSYVIFHNCDVSIFVLSGIIIIVGLLISASNVSLVKHEGFGYKRILGIPIVIVGIISLFSYKIPIICQILCFLNCMTISYFQMCYFATKRKPDYDRDFVIILGCSISKSGSLLPLLKSRTNKAIHFAWDQEIAGGHSVKYIPSGGKGADEIISEGSAIEMYLISHGAENYEVYGEKKSRNTYENMLFSKKIIDSMVLDMKSPKVAFATTNYHVFRSGILAMKAGLDAEGLSSDTKWYFWPDALVREYIAFMKMFLKENIIVFAVLSLILYFILY